MGATAIRPTHVSTLAGSDEPISDGKDTDEEGFSGL